MRRLAILIVLSALPLKSELLPIRTYTTADGLASDRINSIVADSRGFLWFGSPEGLSRFDGYRFVTYGVDEGLPHAAVNALIETRSGDRWIGTPRGVSRIVTSGGNPRFYNLWCRRQRKETEYRRQRGSFSHRASPRVSQSAVNFVMSGEQKIAGSRSVLSPEIMATYLATFNPFTAGPVLIPGMTFR